FPAQSLLYQNPQFVAVGGTAWIACVLRDKIEDGGRAASWFKRREDRVFLLVKNCTDKDGKSRLVCKAEGQTLILQISNTQKEDSGSYFCAYPHSLDVSLSSGSFTVIVGDSYTPSSRVRLLQPPGAPAPQSEQSSHLACLVHGVSGLVQVSWHLPGGLRPEGRTLLAQNRSGSLTFLSLLRVPADSWPRGEPFACEVRLNASGPGIRRNGTWLPATGPAALAQNCLQYTLPVAVTGVLGPLLLLLLLSTLWMRRCPPGPRKDAALCTLRVNNKAGQSPEG
ncbi:hypothetical protein lerEdw1_011520, partial [Lerista edwardsae]